MSQLEHSSFGQSQTQDTLSDKLSREGSLLAHGLDNSWGGLKARAEDSWEHKLETGAEVVGSFVLGAGLSLALKNPETAVVARFVPLVAGALVASDMAKRIGGPMVETWNDSSSLARNKVRLGANIGAMAFDYALMGTSGAAGAHFGPGLAGKIMGAATGADASLSVLGRSGANIKYDPAFEATLVTTKSYGLPLGTSMGMSVAAIGDMARPRLGTNLGALTEITPFNANVNEAFKGMQHQSGEMIKTLNANQAKFQDQTKAWFKSLDTKLKSLDNQFKTQDKQ